MKVVILLAEYIFADHPYSPNCVHFFREVFLFLQGRYNMDFTITKIKQSLIVNYKES